MQTKDSIESIQYDERATAHQQEVTRRFQQFTEELSDNLPAGPLKDECLARMLSAWLFAKEAAGTEGRA